MAGGSRDGVFPPYEATGPDLSAGGVDKLRLQGMVSESRNVMPFGRHITSMN